MKTTIIFSLLAISLTLASTLCAQNPLTLGIKTGVNLSDYSKDIENNDIKVGYNAGVTVDYKLSKYLYILSGLEVTSKGTSIKDRNPLKGSSPEYAKDKITYNPLYLQLPIHVGYTIETIEDMVVIFHTGPYVACGVAGKVTKEIFRGDQKSKEKYDAFGSNGVLKRWDIGMGVGAGLEFKSISLNFGYDLGMLNATKGDSSIKNNTAHVSLGYRFQ